MNPFSKNKEEAELAKAEAQLLSDQQNQYQEETKDEFVENSVNPAKQAHSVNKRKIIAAISSVAVITGMVMAYQHMGKDKKVVMQNEVPSSVADSSMGIKTQELNYARLAEIERAKQRNKDKELKQKAIADAQQQKNYADMQQTDQSGVTVNVSGSEASGSSGVQEKIDDGYINSKISFGSFVSSNTSTNNTQNNQNSTTTQNEAIGGVGENPNFFPEEQKALLTAGTTIPVTLLTGITSKLSGEVIAQVRQDVYDSLTGSILLIPAGAKLIGSYNEQAEGRVSIKFKSIIMPNTKTIELSSARAIDGIGYTGVKDKYTEHTGRQIGAGLIGAVLSAFVGSGNSGTTSDKRSAGQEARDEAVASTMKTIDKIINKKMDKKPTATIRPGFQFNVFLSEDLALTEYWK